MTISDSIPVAQLIEPITIVVTTHNQHDTLRRHLPALLSQDYDQYEVIVVDVCSADNTIALLEALELEYVNLRHLTTPTSARDISLERLALTLGIRAAQYEWVVLTEITCEPSSNHWLSLIGKTILSHPEAGIILGASRYQERNSWFNRQIGFHRLWHQLANYSHILSKHAAVRGDSCNVAVRKSLFMREGGFGTHQNLKTGACDLMVNHFATQSNTRLCLDPRAVMVQDRPSHRQWWQQQVFYVETRRYQRHTFRYRFRNFVSLAWPWFELLFMGIPFVAGLILLCMGIHRGDASYLHPLMLFGHHRLASGVSSPTALEIAIFCIFLLLLLLSMVLITTLRIRQFNKNARSLGCRTYYLTYIIFELSMPFWALHARFLHRFASKNEFRKKFV